MVLFLRMDTEMRTWEIPATQLSLSKTERLFRRGIASCIQEYQSKLHTPELIDNIWQGFWEKAGKMVNHKYQIPRCDRTVDEIAQLEKKQRMVLLLPNDIFTHDGLGRLGKIFPFKMNWTTDQKEALKIFHISTKGGCFDVETSLVTPVDYVLHNESGLIKKIEKEGRSGQRLSTYIVASEFSKLVTMGHPFDEKSFGTWSRLPGSLYEGKVLGARSDSNGYIFDLCNPDESSSSLGGRTESKKDKSNYFWRRLLSQSVHSKGHKGV